jgi:Uma2 family endonuclease
MTALQKLNFLTEQDYLAFELSAEQRHEYVEGQIYAMARGSERHNRIAGNVFFQLRSVTRRAVWRVYQRYEAENSATTGLLLSRCDDGLRHPR